MKQLTRDEVLALANPDKGFRVVNAAINKIEFSDGSLYVYDFTTKKYHKAK